MTSTAMSERDTLARPSAPVKETTLARFARTVERLGFSRYAYFHTRDTRLPGTSNTVFSNYHDEWVQQYLSERYDQIDPVMLIAMRSLGPFQWSSAMRRVPLSIEQKGFMDDAGQIGLIDGVSIPIHAGGSEFALVTVATDRPEQEVSRGLIDNQHELTAEAYRLHVELRASAIAESTSRLAREHLTERQLEIMRWVAIGKSSWDISILLGISERTVNYHIERVMARLGVSSRHLAVVMLVQEGLISV